MILPFLGASHKWNHLIVLLYQAYFTSHGVFKAYWCDSMFQNLGLFMAAYYSIVCVCHYILFIRLLMST